MKNIISFIAIIFIGSATLLAQKVNVSAHTERVNEERIEGFKSKIDGDVDDIISQWTKHLRSLGKYRAKGTYSAVVNFSIDNILFEDSTIYATVSSDESSATVWMGSKMESTDEYSVSEYLKSSVYNFSKRYYMSVVQRQIDEAERAVQITNRRHQRLVKDSVEYVYKRNSSKNEIVRFKQLIEKNELEIIVLDEKLIVNKNERDSVLVEVGRMKKIVDQHKKRKNLIE